MNFKITMQRMAIALSLVLCVSIALDAQATYQLRVDGLACPFCAYGIEKKLNALPGVERLETNIKEGTVFVTMQDGATLDRAAARQAVKDAGFTLKGFEQVLPGDGR